MILGTQRRKHVVAKVSGFQNQPSHTASLPLLSVSDFTVKSLNLSLLLKRLELEKVVSNSGRKD